MLVAEPTRIPVEEDSRATYKNRGLSRCDVQHAAVKGDLQDVAVNPPLGQLNISYVCGGSVRIASMEAAVRQAGKQC